MATSGRLGSLFARTRRGMTEVNRLVGRGQLVDAVDLLADLYRANSEPDLAIRLVDLRQAATCSFDLGPGRTPWPPAYDDPFPDISGRVPEIGGAELTTDVLGGAVAHHGALVVRGLFDDDAVARSVEAIHRAQAERERGSANGSGTAWYRPFASPEKRDQALRRMVADQGGTWLADSPGSTAQVLDDLGSTGVIEVISGHFGERPLFSLQKSTLRRSRPKVKLVAWHQDGSFLDPGVRTMNVWLALSRCGGDYPSPGLEVVPRRMSEILPVDGELTPHSISFELIDQVATETPIIRPEFNAGDALMFDERFIHRTYLDHSMTEYRYALECWFFAPSHRSTGYVPFVV
jgi:hypothetical protein